jgi:hypothetical protein
VTLTEISLFQGRFDQRKPFPAFTQEAAGNGFLFCLLESVFFQQIVNKLE